MVGLLQNLNLGLLGFCMIIWVLKHMDDGCNARASIVYIYVIYNTGRARCCSFVSIGLLTGKTTGKRPASLQNRRTVQDSRY